MTEPMLACSERVYEFVKINLLLVLCGILFPNKPYSNALANATRRLIG